MVLSVPEPCSLYPRRGTLSSDYDALRVIERGKLDAQDAYQATDQHVWGLYLDEQLVYDHDADGDGDFDDIGGSDKRYYVVHAFLYSASAVIDPSAAVKERYDYEAYGKPTFSSGDYLDTRDETQLANIFVFTGQMFDPETGLYHYKSRAHNTALSRLMQRDSAGYPEGISLYEFPRSAPLSVQDPLGLFGYDTKTLRKWLEADPGYGAKVRFLLEQMAAKGKTFEAKDMHARYWGNSDGAWVDCDASTEAEAKDWAVNALREFAGSGAGRGGGPFSEIAKAWATKTTDPAVSLGSTLDFLYFFSRDAAGKSWGRMYPVHAIFDYDLLNIYCWVYTGKSNAMGMYPTHSIETLLSDQGLHTRYWESAGGVRKTDDQTHHFAAFFEFGGHHGNGRFDLGLALAKSGDFRFPNTIRNQGDYDLGIMAADMGADFARNPRYMGAWVTEQLKAGVLPK